MVWYGLVWSGMVWYGLVWVWVWSGMVWYVWYGLVWSGLVWSGYGLGLGWVWAGHGLGMVWDGMGWSGMGWDGMAMPSKRTLATKVRRHLSITTRTVSHSTPRTSCVQLTGSGRLWKSHRAVTKGPMSHLKQAPSSYQSRLALGSS